MLSLRLLGIGDNDHGISCATDTRTIEARSREKPEARSPKPSSAITLLGTPHKPKGLTFEYDLSYADTGTI